MRNISKKKIILLIVFLFVVIIIGVYLYQASQFAKGVKIDMVKRDSVLRYKGIKNDSMGYVNYNDYKKLTDSSIKNSDTNKSRFKR